MSRRLPSSAALRVVPASGQAQLLDFPNAAAAVSGVGIPLEDLYHRFAPYVAAIAGRILGRESEVEDVVQDVFVAALGAGVRWGVSAPACRCCSLYQPASGCGRPPLPG